MIPRQLADCSAMPQVRAGIPCVYNMRQVAAL